MWREDIYEAPLSGRRFKCIFSFHSPSASPFESLSIKTSNSLNITYVALISRNARLTVLESNSGPPEPLASWTRFDEFQVCNPPHRGDETAFRVQFCMDDTPEANLLVAGVNEDALSLVTTAMDTAKIFRTNLNRNFYQVAELAGHRGLVRDVCWADNAGTGVDTLATTCKDGVIRVFEVTVPGALDLVEKSGAYAKGIDFVSRDGRSSNLVSFNPPNDTRATSALSGIGAGLAGVSNIGYNTRESKADSVYTGPDEVRQIAKIVAEIREHPGAVWRVKWTEFGRELVSAGDDGTMRVWKRAIDGTFKEYTEILPE